MDFWKIPTCQWDGCYTLMVPSDNVAFIDLQPYKSSTTCWERTLWKQGSCDPWADASRPTGPHPKRWRRNAYCHCPWQATPERADAPVQPVIVNGQRGYPRLPSTTSWPLCNTSAVTMGFPCWLVLLWPRIPLYLGNWLCRKPAKVIGEGGKGGGPSNNLTGNCFPCYW